MIDGRSSEAKSLVITSLPLNSDRERLTIFAGLHGAGTRAIEKVLNDPPLIDKIHREIRHLLAWQAVIQVHARNSEVPKSIGHYRVFEIANIDFDNPTMRIKEFAL